MRFNLDKYRVERKPVEDHKVVLSLPHLPPSANNLHFNTTTGGRVRTRNYDDWLMQAGLVLNRQNPGRVTWPAKIKISLEDKHARRDASNCIKPVEDLLVKLGILADDRAKYVRSITAEWAPVEGIRIEIERAA